MRNFINVLYRRILYKIPLKRLLVLLAVFAIGLAQANALDLTFISSGTVSLTPSVPTKTAGLSGALICASTNNSNGFYFSGDKVGQYNVVCGIGVVSLSGSSATVRTVIYNVSRPPCPEQYTSLECQSEYSLIPISSVDSEYCENNNLCSYDCPDNGGSGYSNLYINNILHVGAPNIVMNIPEEIDWDYAYTTGGQNMNIDVVGYNVDYDYIDEQYHIQSYKPDSDDLNNIVTNVLPLFVPGLCIILLLYFIFRFIKKIF